MRHVVLGPAVLLIAICSVPASAQSRATEPIVAVVEIMERDETPIHPCGYLGAQPRDVTARILSVEEGSLEGDRVLLSWPVCSLSTIAVGRRYRVHLRVFSDTTRTPETRYRVRRSELAD